MIGSYSIKPDSHISVLLDEAIHYLSPKNGEIYIDGTFGAGGYSRAILNSANAEVFGIDRDPDVKIFADKLASEFPGKFSLILGNFGNMTHLLEEKGVTEVDGVVLDLGVSSMQLATPERGFSFMHDGPLDMRMGRHGKNASDLVNSAAEQEIANIIYRYGGEKKSRRIARAIINAREEKPIATTHELAEIIRKAVRYYNDKIDPATRTFQAIRIWVNDELESLAEGLAAAEKLLKPGGRLVVITFHSLEDTIVKNYLKIKTGRAESYSRHMPIPKGNLEKPAFSLIANKAVAPTEEEIKRNPKSRSAKLRAAKREDSEFKNLAIDINKLLT